MNRISEWFRRNLADQQVVLLVAVLAAVSLAIYVTGRMLAPVFAALVIAYLLQGIVIRLERVGTPHLVAVICTFAIFLTVLLFLIIGLLPLLINQLKQLFQQAPQMLNEAQKALIKLQSEYPTVISEEQVRDVISNVGGEVVGYARGLLSYSVASVVGLITVVVYVILVPFMVFFLIRDKDKLIGWFSRFLPQDRQLTAQVWREVDDQIGNYIRGKVWEIFIVGGSSYGVYTVLDLDYALLLAFLTGTSVIIPYVGAAVVTFPVALVAFFQFGLDAGFYYALIAYGIIQALDGNVLAPLLFSEAVDLHPVAIIVAIFFFGGLWGFWGVFFAIPLATVIQAVLRAWPAASRGGEPAPAAAAGESPS
ncbi:MAG: AI-2E family transporter [Gammaproteobacteria bacterium]|nr:AI-2E family transporter [Gammaproteobacteria bacterium]NNF61964.1 AI-2E family transporter [Gammaproteobacteria bacterium]NNM21864.1 AI-2E family transporter [Gammaproteobacteria bacterium]